MWMIAFVAGYVLGARTDKDEFDDLIDAARAVRDSEEVRALLASVRSHAGHALHGLAEMVEQRTAGDDPRATATSVLSADLVDRVRKLIGDP
jgi:hypothetical protein